jgi:hypothetical protein
MSQAQTHGWGPESGGGEMEGPESGADGKNMLGKARPRRSILNTQGTEILCYATVDAN